MLAVKEEKSVAGSATNVALNKNPLEQMLKRLDGLALTKEGMN